TVPIVSDLPVSSVRSGLPAEKKPVDWLRATVLTKPTGIPSAAQLVARLEVPLPMFTASHGSAMIARFCDATVNRSVSVGTRTDLDQFARNRISRTGAQVPLML